MVVSFGVDAVKCAKTFWELEDTFEKKGIGFKSVTEPFDTTTAMGKGFLGMLGVSAQLEGDLSSE